MLLRVLVFLVLIALGQHGRAEDPFACVDPDFRMAFFEYFARGNTFSTETPGFIEELAVPESWTSIGSSSGQRSERTVFKVQTSVEDAHRDAIALFEGDRWSQTGARHWSGGGGFKSSGTPLRIGLCDSQTGAQVSLHTNRRGDHAFVFISRYEYPPRCDEQEQEVLMMGRAATQHLPTLVIDDQHASEVASAGGGGSGASYSMRGVVSGTMDRAALLQDLDQQLADQGWLGLANWASDLSAGSVWTKSVNQEEPYLGMLEATTLGEGELSLNFRITSLDEQRSRNVQWMSSSGM